MEECETIEKVLKKIEQDNDDPKKKKKYHVPETFFYEKARELFIKPNVERDKAIIEPLMKWNKPEEEALRDYLVT